MIKITAALIVLFAASQCQGFTLELRPSVVETQITENVTLKCYPGRNTSIDGPLMNIRILKEDETLHWNLIAQIETNKADVTVFVTSRLFTSGTIGKVNDSYLTITWPVATADTLGKYRCDILGYNLNGDVVLEKTSEVRISEREYSLQDIMTLVKEYIVRTDNIEKRLNNETQITTNDCCTQLSYVVNQAEYNIYNNTQSLNQLKTVVENLVADIHNFDNSWPYGSFGLLSSSSGCPAAKGGSWQTGYRKHNTESTSGNHDQVSTNNYLQQPVMERSNNKNFMYQHFCVMTSTRWNIFWPSGSYCINRYLRDCPGGFNLGYIHWDDEDSPPASTTSGTLPFGSYSSSETYIDYCCRSDGPVSTHIHLPKDKPFYLYRYKGQCQQVEGMNVSEEFMLFDTESDNNKDSYSNEFHPDGQANKDVRIQLCYYTPF